MLRQEVAAQAVVRQEVLGGGDTVLKSQSLIDSIEAMSEESRRMGRIEYIQDEANRTEGFRTSNVVYIEKRTPKNEIERINLKTPKMNSEKVLVFKRDDLGRVIKITEYTPDGQGGGRNCIFEYDSSLVSSS